MRIDDVNDDTNQVYAGGWLVYFNGIEVPATSVSVTVSVGQMPQATVMMPPSIYLRDLGRGDVVRCTVFYLDHHYFEEPTYCLLFDGEIVQSSYTKSTLTQSQTFVALDLLHVWTKMFPFFVQNSKDIVAAGAGTTQNQQSVASAYAPTTQVLLGDTFMDPDRRKVARPFDVITNLLYTCLGEIVINDKRSVVATEFFKRWNDKVNFIYRFAPSYYEDQIGDEGVPGAGFPILKAAQGLETLDAVKQLGDRFATSGSYYQLIMSVFQHLYYDLQCILAPPINSVNPFSMDTLSATERQSEADTKETAEKAARVYAGIVGAPGGEETIKYAYRIFREMGKTAPPVLGLTQYLSKPKIFFGLPPVFNTIWPCMRMNSTRQENYATQPTRTLMGNPHSLRILGQTIANPLTAYARTVGYPAEVQESLDRVDGNGNHNMDNFLVFPEEFFKGPVYNNINAPAWLTYIQSKTVVEDRKDLERLYAAMEHERAVGAQRNGAENLTFNPYLVCGVPTLVIDDGEANAHTFCECVSISHSLTQNAMSTSMNYTQGRTISEVFELMQDSFLEFGLQGLLDPHHFGPRHPLEELRQLFQVPDKAREYYNRVFFNRDDRVNSLVSWTDLFEVRIPANPESEEEDGDIPRRAQIPLFETGHPSTYPDPNTGYTPFYLINQDYDSCLDNHEDAMTYASRPVCTLDQYIAYNGDRGVSDELRTPTHPTEGKAASYYVRILNLVQGPANEPGTQSDGGRCSTLETDTVRNWERTLLNYRNSVYNDDAPQEG